MLDRLVERRTRKRASGIPGDKVFARSSVASADHRVDLAAKEEERVWVKRQTDGELDDSRLTEGLTGEATVYKRRGMEKPELGRPRIKYAFST